MKESLYNADQELKRAEHLLYVSLKYTRTGDVIKSLVMRLIASFEYTIKGMLIKQEQDGAIDSIPERPFMQVTLIKKLYSDDKIVCDFMDFYILLRKISREAGNSTSEFRRNLTLSVPIDGKTIEITIDIAGDYYHKTVEFFRYICQLHLA
ncbi:MAG: hypothetical protein ACMXYE_00645 [Candidatus Woesearchaeota archaeon]